MIVTIFTPTYNRAYSLPQLYKSLCSQTSSDFEWIIVDDCSSDNTKSLVREWIEEKKSGTIDYHKRNLGDLINQLKENDVLVVTEISRLGRSLNMIFNIISELQNKGVRVIAIKNNFDLNPQKKNDITAQVLMFAFGLSAQIERDLISERTKQGLIVAKSKGKVIGRRKGEMIYNVKLRKSQRKIRSRPNYGGY